MTEQNETGAMHQHDRRITSEALRQLPADAEVVIKAWFRCRAG